MVYAECTCIFLLFRFFVKSTQQCALFSDQALLYHIYRIYQHHNFTQKMISKISLQNSVGILRLPKQCIYRALSTVNDASKPVTKV